MRLEGFWLLLWCLVLLWAFSGAGSAAGFGSEIAKLAAGWNDTAAAGPLFASVENDCRRVERFRQDLVRSVKRSIASAAKWRRGNIQTPFGVPLLRRSSAGWDLRSGTACSKQWHTGRYSPRVVRSAGQESNSQPNTRIEDRISVAPYTGSTIRRQFGSDAKKRRP